MEVTKAIFLFVISLLLLFQSSFQSHSGYNETEFRYDEASGRGPSRWGELDPHWRTCSTGRMQSPINLQNPIILPALLGGLRIAYQPANATISSSGHDIMVSWTGDAGFIRIYGIKFTLKHCHWHTPTEHAINGVRYDLELHLVHESTSGLSTAVVGIPYKIGQPDPFLERLLPEIRSVTKEEKPLGMVNAGDIGFPSTNNYYRYWGSLTTPPCTEGVLWTVFKQVRNVSMEQVEALMNAVDDGFEMNARPIQATNGRLISLYK